MNCKQGTQHIVTQITNLLDCVDTKAYKQPLNIFKGSTLGQHFRHILDFYQCLLNGLDQSLVDYSSRQRDPKAEIDPGYARQAFMNLAVSVDQLPESQTVMVRTDFFNDEKNRRPIVQSSIGRELMFAYDHAVHHLAMIKIGIGVACPDLELDENLGMAPATVKYRAGNSNSSS